jgi:hypothetical protein
MGWLGEFLFGCSHDRTTFPLTRRVARSGERRQTYVACLDCGREFPYNWQEMRIELGEPAKAVPGFLARLLRFGN